MFMSYECTLASDVQWENLEYLSAVSPWVIHMCMSQQSYELFDLGNIFLPLDATLGINNFV